MPLQGTDQRRQRLPRGPDRSRYRRRLSPEHSHQGRGPQARNGNSDLLTTEVAQSTLGWTAAGAYYLEIAKLNAATLSLLNATPISSSPTYEGLGPAMSYDLAPLDTAQATFMTTLNTIVQTVDGTSVPNGVPHTLADAKENATGMTVLDRVFGAQSEQRNSLHDNHLHPADHPGLDRPVRWSHATRPAADQRLPRRPRRRRRPLFRHRLDRRRRLDRAHLQLGRHRRHPARPRRSSASSASRSSRLLTLLFPGIIIAYVLPMIPYVMWMAGVLGWIILVCEAMIAVPLWMLAHMTVGGEGLHGRAIEGWSLLFSIVFRPILMVIGLFLGYFVFDCMSWLIRESFGIAAGFVLSNGWIVANFIGIGVLLTIFVMTHVAAAIMSFRMVALLPHHLPRLIGFTAPTGSITTPSTTRPAGHRGTATAALAQRTIGRAANQFGQQQRQLRGGPSGYISGPSGGGEAGDEGGMDTTLRATTDQGDKGAEDV